MVRHRHFPQSSIKNTSTRLKFTNDIKNNRGINQIMIIVIPKIIIFDNLD